MAATSLDESLARLGRTDATFNEEIRGRLAPVRSRFLAAPTRTASAEAKDGLHTSPPYLTEPDLRKVAIEIAELALDRGIDVNVACDEDGSTFLHLFALLRDQTIAVSAVEWLLAHGADPNRPRNDGETPLGLAIKFGRTQVVELLK